MADTELQETPAPANAPVEKFPELAAMRDRLQEEEKALLEKSAPLRKQREELLTRVQPLENKLREVNKALIAIEQPRLAEIKTQLGRLAVAMGGRAMNQPPPA